MPNSQPSIRTLSGPPVVHALSGGTYPFGEQPDCGLADEIVTPRTLPDLRLRDLDNAGAQPRSNQLLDPELVVLLICLGPDRDSHVAAHVLVAVPISWALTIKSRKITSILIVAVRSCAAANASLVRCVENAATCVGVGKACRPPSRATLRSEFVRRA